MNVYLSVRRKLSGAIKALRSKVLSHYDATSVNWIFQDTFGCLCRHVVLDRASKQRRLHAGRLPPPLRSSTDPESSSKRLPVFATSWVYAKLLSYVSPHFRYEWHFWRAPTYPATFSLTFSQTYEARVLSSKFKEYICTNRFFFLYIFENSETFYRVCGKLSLAFEIYKIDRYQNALSVMYNNDRMRKHRSDIRESLRLRNEDASMQIE